MIAQRKQGAVIIILLALAVSVSLLVISNHARTSHAAENWSAMWVLHTIKGANNGDDKLCKSLEIAFCPNAVNSFTGRKQPHAKVFCELPQTGSERLYAVGIFGLGDTEPVYVTGYAMSAYRKTKVITRDQCVSGTAILHPKFFVRARKS